MSPSFGRAEVVVSNVVDSRFLHGLRRLGFVEGLSTLVLFFVAMPLKYLAGKPEAVRISGRCTARCSSPWR